MHYLIIIGHADRFYSIYNPKDMGEVLCSARIHSRGGGADHLPPQLPLKGTLTKQPLFINNILVPARRSGGHCTSIQAPDLIVLL